MYRAGGIVSLLADFDHTQVERAISEFRSGRPVLIVDTKDAVLAIGVEALEQDFAAQLDSLAQGRARLVLPAARLRRLGVERTTAGAVALPSIDAARIEMLALKVDARVDAPVGPASPVDLVAMELASLSLVLPAVVTLPVEADKVSDAVVRIAGDLIRRLSPRDGPKHSHRQPRPGTARGRARYRIRDFPRRRGPARPGRHHRRQAGPARACDRTAALGLPDGRSLRQPEMRLRRPVAGRRALDGG